MLNATLHRSTVNVVDCNMAKMARPLQFTIGITGTPQQLGDTQALSLVGFHRPPFPWRCFYFSSHCCLFLPIAHACCRIILVTRVFFKMVSLRSADRFLIPRLPKVRLSSYQSLNVTPANANKSKIITQQNNTLLDMVSSLLHVVFTTRLDFRQPGAFSFLNGFPLWEKLRCPQGSRLGLAM